jgi:bifunctional UDP-N-acetylglucosamine pyrophosphorylase/glucosamine-1-phosphate N-acetyltransferase
MIQHCYEHVSRATSETPILVIGVGADQVMQEMGEKVRYIIQEEQLGTAHAVIQAEKVCGNDSDLILVVSGDMPLFKPETLAGLVEAQKQNKGPISLLTVILEDSHGFGRILRDPQDQDKVIAIIEESQASPEQARIRECNVGAYCFKSNWLWKALKKIKVSPRGEYFLTDVVEIAVKNGESVDALTIADPREALGINNRIHLAEAEAIMRMRNNTHWMMEGVTIIDPGSTSIEGSVQIGQDTILYPNSNLKGNTIIGRNCSIGPATVIDASQIGDSCTILASVIEYAQVENEVEMGPYCHLRKGAHLASNVHMGNFGEVKDSFLAEGVKMGHFSYIGNATIGKDVNIGAGTITCNFDGVNKNPTVIEDDVFIGSDTMLVAPVTIKKGAKTGAGSVVNKDVSAGEVVVGVPARPLKKRKV